ncbi:S41 family peptidase [Erythrobacter ani]|uniref:S41 family peptidase n=1 Tax=Erythrobacter ani TaxID=2827235 RepID=A0ABS6SNZ0_9SPHN|nr:S41 family peptidase [Erythrobacter ani]MBV7266746.1 S41 family peptidase [Erythrobacter ani]
MKGFLAMAASCLISTAALAEPVSPEEQREALYNAELLIEARYVQSEKVEALAATLQDLQSAIDGPSDGREFADTVTARLREVSADGHLGLSYSEQPIAKPAQDEQLTLNDDFAQWYGKGVNHGVEKIERLSGNVMLLDLRAFPPPGMGGDVIAAAMTTVAQGDALIIDLRKNGGGADTVLLVMAYLVAPGSPFLSTYDRPSDRWTHQSIPAWVPGRRFGEDKPIYVLTSGRTFSAAEALAYSLQAMGRATIVGETTGGGAHPFEYRRVSAHFALDLPEGKSEHPLTGTNWQGVGVRPDVEVPEAQALAKAQALAREAVTNR